MGRDNRNFKADISINKYDLVEELTNQPQLFYEWAKASAEASHEVTVLKDRIDILKSEIELRIRRNPTLFGLLEKPTEAQIKAAVNTHKKVKRINKKYFDALRIESLLKKIDIRF